MEDFIFLYSVFPIFYQLFPIYSTSCGSMSTIFLSHSTEMAHAKVLLIRYNLILNQLVYCVSLKWQTTLSFLKLLSRFILNHFQGALTSIELLFLNFYYLVSHFSFHIWLLSFIHLFNLFFRVTSLVLFFSDLLISLTVSCPLLELPSCIDDRIYFSQTTVFPFDPQLKTVFFQMAFFALT